MSRIDVKNLLTEKEFISWMKSENDDEFYINLMKQRKNIKFNSNGTGLRKNE